MKLDKHAMVLLHERECWGMPFTRYF